MPAKSSQTESDGFSAEERAAMKARAAELRAEGKKGAKKADGLQDVLDAIAKMAPDDRALAERVHVAITANAPQLSPKTWYGMPAYANADGKAVVFFQDSGKFKYRYSTVGFQDTANLDDGDLWPVSYALQKWSPAVEKKLVRAGQGRDRLTTAATPRFSAVIRSPMRVRAPGRPAGAVGRREWNRPGSAGTPPPCRR